MFDCQADTPAVPRHRTAPTRPRVSAPSAGTSYSSQMASQTLRTGTPGVDRVDRVAAAQGGEDVVAGHAVGTHRPELTVEAGPELLQAHAPTLTRRPPAAHRPRLARVPARVRGAWTCPADRDRAGAARVDRPADQELPGALSRRPGTSTPRRAAGRARRDRGDQPEAAEREQGTAHGAGERRTQPHQQVGRRPARSAAAARHRLGDQRRAGDQPAGPAQAQQEQPRTQLDGRAGRRGAGQYGGGEQQDRRRPRPSSVRPTRSASMPTSGENRYMPATCTLMTRPMIRSVVPGGRRRGPCAPAS